MTARNPDCTKFEPLLDALRDGELSSDERRAVEQHASSCTSCQGQLADIERIVATLQALPRVRPARDFSQDLDALLAQQPPAKIISFRPVVWGSISVAAVAAAVAVVVFKPGFGPEQAIVTRDGSGDGRQRLHAGTPRPNLPEKTTAVANGGNDQAPPVRQPTQKQRPESGPVVANAPEAGQQVPPAPEANPEGKPPAGRTAEKTPESTEPDSGLPAVAPQPPVPRRGLNGRTAIAEVDDVDDPFAAGGAAVVALAAGDQSSITEDLGLATDEDGLYAIKM